MPTYDTWNTALLEQATVGQPRGAEIFLNVDDDTLNVVGSLLGLEHGQGVADFESAVRKQITTESDRGRTINLTSVKNRKTTASPAYVGVLACFVLAASRMQEDGDIDQKNYFRRLRQVLNFIDLDGRPSGLATGEEELLWKQWSRWLLRQNFIPTATAGSGPTLYIHYPISQTMLRKVEKDWLRQRFNERNYRVGLDPETVYLRVQSESNLPRHLKEICQQSTTGRTVAITDAIYQVYTENQAGPDNRGDVFAGLYRMEDPFFGGIQYLYYPRAPKGFNAAIALALLYGNETVTLSLERPGFFEPFGDVTKEALDQGNHFESVRGGQSVAFPIRKFWILIQDPDRGDTGVQATWGYPPLGSQFTLLLNASLKKDLDELKKQKLLSWSAISEPFAGWLEIQQCQVVGDRWDQVFIEERALLEALRPYVELSIYPVRGLRTVDGDWISPRGPTLRFLSFLSEGQVEIQFEDEIVFSQTVDLSEEISPDCWNEPGSYIVRVIAGGKTVQKNLRLLDWKKLRKHNSVEFLKNRVSSEVEISGAAIL